jgi:CxxC motif-containing protein
MNQETTKHKLLCIICPEGCEMDIDEKDGTLVFPKGICRRGQEYARQELYNPCRVLTTTVSIRGGEIAMLPVRTSQPIPKAKLIEAMQQIANIEGKVPVKTGEVICRDIASTGVSLIACRTILRRM